MSVVSGCGGTATMTAGGNTVLDVRQWRLQKRATLGEYTHSGTAGWEKHKAAKKGGNLTIEIIWDTTKTPETAGCDIGDEWSVDLKIGDSTIGYNDVPVVTESIELTGCTQEGVPVYTLQAKTNGPITDPAAI